MKRFRSQIVLFSLMVIIGYPIVIYTLHISGARVTNLDKNILKKGHLKYTLSEVDSTKNRNVLFLGSSHSYRGFDPRAFSREGISSFNLGSSAQTPKQTRIIVSEYLEKLSPDLIIIEVSPLYFCYVGQESTLDFIRNTPSFSLKIKFLWEGLDVFNFNSFLVSEINSLVNDDVAASILTKEDQYIKGGFVEKKIRFNSPHKYKASDQAEVLEEQFNCFEGLINEIEEMGLKYLLVQSPVTKQFYNNYNQGQFQQKLSKYKYVDYNGLLDLNDSLDFYDAHHLNQFGVEKFNRLLIYNLKNDGDL